MSFMLGVLGLGLLLCLSVLISSPGDGDLDLVPLFVLAYGLDCSRGDCLGDGSLCRVPELTADRDTAAGGVGDGDLDLGL